MPQAVQEKLRQGRSEKPEPIANSPHSLELVISSNSTALQGNMATVQI